MFEKQRDVGGVWLANTYPGCAVDTPAYLYSFSFEQNTSQLNHILKLSTS